MFNLDGISLASSIRTVFKDHNVSTNVLNHTKIGKFINDVYFK